MNDMLMDIKNKIATIYKIIDGNKEYAFKVSVGIPELIFNTSCNIFF